MSGRPALYEKLLPVLPQKPLPIVRASIESIGQLPGLKNWNPTITPELAFKVIRIGFPLTYLSSVRTCDRLRRRIAYALLSEQDPDPSDLAECNAAALCITLGAVALEHVKRSTRRTPDFKICWPSQTEIDLEVTCAAEKAAHVDRMRIASKLVERIHNKARSFDIVLHYIDPPTEDESVAIIKAAYEVTPGNAIEEPGKWALRAEKPQRDPYTAYTAGEPTNEPDWWPRQPIKRIILYQSLPGPGAIVSPPRTRVLYAVPFDTYINPVQSKADRPQSSGGQPYLIAIDVGNLGGAYGQFRQRLPEYFRIWKRLSGVLTFSSWINIGSSRMGWTWGLIVNPFAACTLPIELQDKGRFNKEMDTFVPLQERGKLEGDDTDESG